MMVSGHGNRLRAGILPNLLFASVPPETGCLWGFEKQGRHILVADDVDRVACDTVLGETLQLLENRGAGGGIALACGHDFYLPDSFFFIATTSSRNGQIDRVLMERCGMVDVTGAGEPHELLFRWLRVTFWKVFGDSRLSQERQEALLCVKALRRANQTLQRTGAIIGHARFLQGSTLAQFVRLFSTTCAHSVMPVLDSVLVGAMRAEEKALLLDLVSKTLARQIDLTNTNTNV